MLVNTSFVHISLYWYVELKDIKGWVVLLESYIERKGVILPLGFVQPKMIIIN
jgi:hypothetical protein